MTDIERWSDADIARRVALWGPRGLRTLSDETIASKVSPRLRQLVESKSTPGHLLILGPTGTGKTLTAFALARRWLTAQYRRVYSLPDLDGRIGKIPKPLWTNANELAAAKEQQALGTGEPDEIYDAKCAPLLVLDELGWEMDRAQTIRRVVSYRYELGLITIATSGLTAPQMIERYGDAVARRFTELRGEKTPVIDLHPKVAT